jgi:arylsulfatase A-like enzyme
LDALIKHGTYFSQAVSCAPITVPSISSMFTAQYPFESTTLDNNMFNLALDVPNFVDKLSDVGYGTYAVLPEGISHTNIPKKFHDGIYYYKSFATLYDGIGDKIVNNLNSNLMKTPWFYYIELQDLHGHAEFVLSSGPSEFKNEKYGKNQYERMVSMVDIWLGKITNCINFDNTIVVITADHGSSFAEYTTKLEQYEQRTDKIRTHNPSLAYKSAHKIITKFPKSLNPLRKRLSEIYTDNKYARLQDKLKLELQEIDKLELSPYEKRLMQNSVVRVPQPFDEHFRIPLLLSGGTVPQNKKIHQQVRSVDIFPTLFEILNLPQIEKTRGQNLLSIMKDQTADEYVAYLDSAALRKESKYKDTIGLRTSNFKYFRDRSDEKKDVHLFDLHTDPLEENNICEVRADVISEMESQLAKIKNNKDFSFKKTKVLTDDEVQKAKDILKTLGYI